MDHTAFLDWMIHAGRGTMCCYHRGLLMFDREPQGHPRRAALNMLADTVFGAQKRGQVELFQRRVGDMDYQYLAVRS